MKFQKTRLVSIRQHITWMTVIVSGTVLIISAFLFTVYEAVSIRQEASQHVTSLARILASGVVGPVATGDSRAAESVLHQAQGSERVVTAYVFDKSGQPIAHYIREVTTTSQLNAVRDMELFELEARQIKEGLNARSENQWFESGYLGKFIPITLEGDMLGALYIRADIDFFTEQAQIVLLTMLLILGGSIYLSFLLAKHFQKKISGSITMLATHVDEVVTSKDWKLLSDEPLASEFKVLYEGFNSLMDSLRERDTRLTEHQQYLEKEVEKRTKDLQIVNAQLVRANEDSEKANTAKSMLLANVSHEIRTPMVGVLGMAELLVQADLDSRHHELAATVYRSARSLMGLLEDLLDFSKIEAGRLTLEKSRFNLRRVAEDVMCLMAPKAFNKGIEFNLLMLPSVPEEIEGDAGRIRQMFLNLVGNAIKFTESGSVQLKIWHVPGPEDGVFHVEASDTGIGISSQDQEKIFDSFQQCGTNDGKRQSGTGLGLAIVRELTGLMGGTVQVESLLGQGSRFTMKLPLRVLDNAGFDPGVRLHLTGNHARVAISSPETRRVMTEVLKSLRMDVAPVETKADFAGGLKGSAVDRPFFLLCDQEYFDALPEIFDTRVIKQVVFVHPNTVQPSAHLSKCKLPVTSLSLPLQMHELASALMPVTPMVPSHLMLETKKAEDNDETAIISGRPSILVVEDNTDSQKLLEILLSKNGYDVKIVDNGEKAFDAVINGNFDLTFMDCQMPVLDGFSATRKIRQHGIDMPIIALTAYGRNEEFQKCLDAGMNDCLTKPFRQRHLFDILVKWGLK